MKTEIINNIVSSLENVFGVQVKRGIEQFGQIDTYTKMPLIYVNSTGMNVENIYIGAIHTNLHVEIRLYNKNKDMYYESMDEDTEKLIIALSSCDIDGEIVNIEITEMINDGTIDPSIYAIRCTFSVKYRINNQ